MPETQGSEKPPTRKLPLIRSHRYAVTSQRLRGDRAGRYTRSIKLDTALDNYAACGDSKLLRGSVQASRRTQQRRAGCFFLREQGGAGPPKTPTHEGERWFLNHRTIYATRTAALWPPERLRSGSECCLYPPGCRRPSPGLLTRLVGLLAPGWYVLAPRWLERVGP